jgi:phytoene/squalene synthetase
MITEPKFTPQFQAMMEWLVDYTGEMLEAGGEIVNTVDAELAVTLRLFVQGGRAALDGIVKQGYDVLQRRPSVSKATKLRLLAGALAGMAAGLFSNGRPPE